MLETVAGYLGVHSYLRRIGRCPSKSMLCAKLTANMMTSRRPVFISKLVRFEPYRQGPSRSYCSSGQPESAYGPSVPECNAPRQGRYFYAAQLPGAITDGGIASILRAGVCYFGADQLDPWRSLELKEYNLGWKERYEEYVEYFEPENAEKAWGVINETLIGQRRLRAVKLGFLRLPREWVLCAGPQLPKTRDPKLTEDGVPHLIFLSPDMILTLARKHFSPHEVVSAIDLHPSMARFLDKSTCVPADSVNLKLVEKEFEQSATNADPRESDST